MKPLILFSPAKINLYLAITGRREDGFHSLLSVVAPVEFGDELTLEETQDGTYSLTCDQPGVPVNASNLVLRAAHLYAEATGVSPSVHFRLTKRVPMGAGLGGGSTNGTAALVGLNRWHGSPLSQEQLTGLAARLGSDCVLFLQAVPCVMRGRGEQIEALPAAAVSRLSGRRVLLFKPSFGIATAWAYRDMAANAPASYENAEAAEQRIAEWIKAPAATAETLVANNMERAAFAKYLALPALLDALRSRFAVSAGLSGSGSACFALLPETMDAGPLILMIREAWGEETFVTETRIG